MLQHLLPVYRRSDIVITRGEECYLYDDKGQAYLDFATGIAVNALGHCHPKLVDAIQRQAETLWHCSNLFRMPALEAYAQALCAHSFADNVFLCSTGSEAVEAAVKIMRRYHWHNGNAARHRIITFEGGFHGRSITGISAGGNARAREGYHPLLEGFDRVPWQDLHAVEKSIGEETAGILIEPIQGEGGIRVAGGAFLQALRKMADVHGLLLCVDEVQCGMGRSGTLFAHEQAGILPDILTTAKGIGNGFPLAACMVTDAVSACMTPGSHGSTYGGNPLAVAVGQAVLEEITQPEFLARVALVGNYLQSELEQLQQRFPDIIKEVRGEGLMLGVQLHAEHNHREFSARLTEQRLLTAPATEDNVIRILPPLIINEKHVQEAVAIFTHICEKKI